MMDKVCLEIGRNVIKVAQGNFGNKLSIKRYFEVNIDSSTVLDEDNWDENILSEIITNIFNENKLKKSGVNIVLTSISNLLIREMVVPLTDHKDTYNIIKYEAMQYFPVNIENYLIDYKTIEVFEEEKKKKQRILVVAIKKEIVEKIIRISKVSGIKINKIDIEANVLSKILPKDSSDYLESAVIVVNIERKFITSVVVKKSMVQLAKTYPHNLEEVFNDKEKNSESITNQYLIDEVIDNISKLMNYYTTREKTSIRKIYLTGELAYSYDMNKILNEKTGVETLILNKIDYIKDREDINARDICSFSIVFGGLI